MFHFLFFRHNILAECQIIDNGFDGALQVSGIIDIANNVEADLQVSFVKILLSQLLFQQFVKGNSGGKGDFLSLIIGALVVGLKFIRRNVIVSHVVVQVEFRILFLIIINACFGVIIALFG